MPVDRFDPTMTLGQTVQKGPVAPNPIPTGGNGPTLPEQFKADANTATNIDMGGVSNPIVGSGADVKPAGVQSFNGDII